MLSLLSNTKSMARETFITIILYALAIILLSMLAYKFLYGSGLSNLAIE